MRGKILILTLTALCCAGAGAAEVPTRPATDAERRAAGIDDPALPLLIRENPAPSLASVRLGPTGSPANHYLSRLGTAFVGRSSAYAYDGEPPSIYCPAGTSEHFATATLDLPGGARIHYLDAFGYDGSASDDMEVFLESVCQATNDISTSPVVTNLGSVSTSGSPGDTVFTLDLGAAPVTVDAYSCRYFARVRLSDVGTPCVADIYLDKVRVQYTRN